MQKRRGFAGVNRVTSPAPIVKFLTFNKEQALTKTDGCTGNIGEVIKNIENAESS